MRPTSYASGSLWGFFVPVCKLCKLKSMGKLCPIKTKIYGKN